MPSVKRRASKILNEYGAAQSELVGKAVVLTSHRLRVAQIACSFQSSPIKMKTPTSVRKVTPMIVTMRNTSLGERWFTNTSHLAKPASKPLRLENVSVPNADGATCERRAGIRGGLRRSPLRVNGLNRSRGRALRRAARPRR